MNKTKFTIKNDEILRIIEKDLGLGRRIGRWVMFSCPFPGHEHGDRHPSLGVTPDNGRFYCFSCGRTGDAVTYLQLREGLTFIESCKRLSLFHFEDRPHKTTSRPSEIPPTFDEKWQAASKILIEQSEKSLCSPEGSRALTWLRETRGVSDRTIHQYRLGFNPTDRYEPLDAWGLSNSRGGKTQKIYIPRGIVIPCLISDRVWYVKIRRSTGIPKYLNLSGGRVALFGAENLLGADVGLLTEGEFDAILADQEIGEICGVATLGSATATLDITTWGKYLMPLNLILIAYDLDEAGEIGAKKLISNSDVIHLIQVPKLRPEDKDLTDYKQAGGDLSEWFRYHLGENITLKSGWRLNAISLGAIIHEIKDGED